MSGNLAIGTFANTFVARKVGGAIRKDEH
jgi:hypothetical protein